MLHKYFLYIFLILIFFNRFHYSSEKYSANLKYEDIFMKSPSPPHPVTARGDFIKKKL